MSYILDALKKAERERGLAKVPTLSSIHESQEKPRGFRLAASAVALAILAVGFGAYLLLSSGEKSPAAATRPHDTAEPVTATYPAASVSVPAPSGTQATEPFTVGTEKAAGMPQTGVPTAVNGSSDRQPEPSNFRSEPRPQGTAPLPKRTESAGFASSPYVQPAVPQADIRTPHENPSSPALPAVESSPTDPASSGSSTLMQAVDGMSITILRYAQDRADRLVFINGRKYVEGDYIDGRFLIESITRDGAVLSYEGARATLKASGY
jgi:general secretion pathway protein B